jgi:hypothetical protein
MSIREEEREARRLAYYVERKSQRQIGRRGRSRETVKQIIEGREGERKEALVYEPYRERGEGLLQESECLPPKQHYTEATIYEIIRGEGYEGCESRIRP